MLRLKPVLLNNRENPERTEKCYCFFSPDNFIALNIGIKFDLLIGC
jgi:hypothetical protein